jgi:hypothetical protein
MTREEAEALVEEVGQAVDRKLGELRLEIATLRADNRGLHAELALLRADLAGTIERTVERAVVAKTPVAIVNEIKSAGIAVPIMRGYWNAETTYLPGDRVIKAGEWSALKMSLGIDPTGEDLADSPAWLKVGGKNAKTASSIKLEGGKLTDSGREVVDLDAAVEAIVDRRFAHCVKEYAAKQAA